MEYHEKPRICRTMVKQTYPLRNFWTELFMGASSCLSLFLTKAIRPYFHFLVADLHNTLRSTKGGILSLGLMVVYESAFTFCFHDFFGSQLQIFDGQPHWRGVEPSRLI